MDSYIALFSLAGFALGMGFLSVSSVIVALVRTFTDISN